jgi:hypothetical protein
VDIPVYGGQAKLRGSSRVVAELPRGPNNAAAESGPLDMVPTSPVVPTLSQPAEGVGDTKSRLKATVSPTSPCGPNLLLHIHVGERKRSGTCFSIRKEKDPRWGHRGWDRIRSSHWSRTIKICPNPLEGWDHAVGGWDRGGPSVDSPQPQRPRLFSLWRRPSGCYILR